MIKAIRQLAIDAFQINLPWYLSVATLNTVDIDRWLSLGKLASQWANFIVIVIGGVFTVLVGIKKLKGKNEE